MPLLNFKKQFVEPIREGRKHHTIRAVRAVPIKAGDNLYLYSGLRQKGAFRILPEPQTCTRVQQIQIKQVDGPLPTIPWFELSIDGVALDVDERERLAIADGFTTFKEMMEFWDGRLPFKGQIIHWR